MTAIAPWPFIGLKPRSQRVILADPPWLFENWSAKGEGKNPAIHYPCQRTAELARLPVRDLAAPDAVLFMFAIAPMVEDAYWLARAYGFTPKTLFSWTKLSKTGTKLQFGTGYIGRSTMEYLLVCTIGRPQIRDTRAARSIRNLVLDDGELGLNEMLEAGVMSLVAPVRQHSRKPDQVFDMIETMHEGPYCELYSRQSRPGWSAWGNEIGKFDAVAAE